MTGSCPSDLRLERHLLDPATSGLETHLAGCAACRERLARMEAEGEAFRRFVYPATVDAVVEASERPRRRPWLPAIAALGAAFAGVILLVGRPGPDPDYVGEKGDPLGLAAYVGGAGGSRQVHDGDAVAAGSALRFQVRAPRACHLWIVSADGSGSVSRIYPVEGDTGATLSAPGPLPGGAVLDGRPGPERIYALCSPDPLPYETVARLVRAATAGGEGAVRATSAVPGLPARTVQASLLLEKRP